MSDNILLPNKADARLNVISAIARRVDGFWDVDIALKDGSEISFAYEEDGPPVKGMWTGVGDINPKKSSIDLKVEDEEAALLSAKLFFPDKQWVNLFQVPVEIHG